jgi:hypothetical protein
VSAPGSESEALATRLAAAAERLKTQREAPPGVAAADVQAADPEDALALLREVSDELEAADAELRRVRAEIARAGEEPAVRRDPLDAA